MRGIMSNLIFLSGCFLFMLSMCSLCYELFPAFLRWLIEDTKDVQQAQ